MAIKKVGGEVDSLCGKCKMTLAHTILAMVGDKVVRVQCNTCGSQHAHRGPQATSEKAPRARAASSKKTGGTSTAASKITVTFEQLLGQKDASLAKRYSVKDTYALDDLLEHPTFGYGIVTAARSDKVTVLFKMEEKTLVHGRGGAPAAKPTFERPRAAATGPADKPMSEASGPTDAAPAVTDDAPDVSQGDEEPLS